MIRPFFERILAYLLSCCMAFSVFAPSIAVAQTSQVSVQNHTQADGRQAIGGIRIDGVDAPEPGKPLDDKAAATAEGGIAWEIPVLWVSNDLRLVTQAEKDNTYLPVLAFFVPQEYQLEGDAFAVELSDSLTKLFGGEEVISVYNDATGITYILPASIRDLFVTAKTAATAVSKQAEAGPAVPATSAPRLVELYCAKSARDALTDADLEWLIDLVVNTLEPQAVNLLLSSFPAFAEGAQNGEIGTQIGMYIYYNVGDKDGVAEHEGAIPRALAYAMDKAVQVGDDYQYSYMIGINVDSLLQKDKDRNPVRNEATGKFTLLRSGENMLDFQNTVVHELLHVIMFDYNRTGMTGVTNTKDYLVDEKENFVNPAIEKSSQILRLPNWFIEGSASSVENIFQFRKNFFDALRSDKNGNTQDTFTVDALVDNYFNGTYDNKPALFDLVYSLGKDAQGNEIDNRGSAYVCGYLATLYLADLAAIKDTGASALQTNGDVVTNVSTETLRTGLNRIFERIHDGETFDQVIADISPVNDKGEKVYANTDDFQAKFIKGTATNPRQSDAKQSESANRIDSDSASFVTDYLNYLNKVTNRPGRQYVANGSIIMPVDVDVASPLDDTKTATSDYLKIIESNKVVPSTVPDSVAFASGGKSALEPAEAQASSAAQPAEGQVAEQQVVEEHPTEEEATELPDAA